MTTIIPIGIEQSAIYTIVGPRGDRAVLNDPTDPDYVGHLSKPPVGLERAAPRESGEDLVQGDGGINGNSYRSRLTFSMEGVIPPDNGTLDWITRQDRLMAATDALRQDAMLTFTPAGGAPPVRLRFREQQATRITGARPKDFILAGVAEDVGVEARDESVATIAPGTEAVGGRSYPKAYPKTYAPTVGASVLVANRGRRTAWPLLRLYGPMADPVVLNATTGERMVFRYALLETEFLEIDTHPSRRSVMLNGSANRYNAFAFQDSDWWGLGPGITTDVRLNVSSIATGARLDIIWRDAWG